MPEEEVNEKEDIKPVEATEQPSQETANQAVQKEAEPVAQAAKKKTNILLIIGVVVGVLFLLIVLLVIFFGSPDAKTVFKDMNAEMLKTKTVLITQNYKGKISGNRVEIDSKASMDMTSGQTLKTQGDFVIRVIDGETPMTVRADFITIGDNKYIKFNEMSSTDKTLNSAFDAIESKIKGHWIKSRPADNYSSLASNALESVLTIFPTPYANLTKDQQTEVLKIMQDKSTYTIDESTKVELGGVNTYKYSISYDKKQYNLFAKKIAEYVKYLKSSNEENDSDIKKYDVWVNISSKQIAKIEFEGTAKDGDTLEGEFTLSDYNKVLNINKPDDYSMESELLL